MKIGNLLILISGILLVISTVLSVKSFTGYVVTDNVNNGMNIFSLAMFFLGLAGSSIWIRKYRIRR
jgi:hypothetical protein